MDQAAENEGAAILLDPVGGHPIHLATEQLFKANGQGDEAETDRLREARQSIHVAWCISQISLSVVSAHPSPCSLKTD
jgi:hypothetical protein